MFWSITEVDMRQISLTDREKFICEENLKLQIALDIGETNSTMESEGDKT